MTLNACIIGCGFIAKKHVQVIAQLEGFHLHSLCDVDLERTKEIEMLYRSMRSTNEPQQIKHFQDAEEVFNNNEIDVVIITTTSKTHAPLATKALLAGKHVILEKPMALSLEDGKKLYELSKEKNIVLLICHQLRYRPLFQKIKELLDEGVLGKPYLGAVSIRIHRSDEYYRSAPWRGTWDLDGGMLINQGIHLIDLLQWFLGDIRSVYGEIGKAKMHKETEDYAVGIVNFHNQARGIIEVNTVTLPKNIGYSLSLFCEKGTICIDGPAINEIRRWYIDKGVIPQPNNSIMEDMNERLYMYKDFIDTVKNKKENVLVCGEEGIKAIETIFSLYKSSLMKQPIHLPLDNFNLSMMKEENEKWIV